MTNKWAAGLGCAAFLAISTNSAADDLHDGIAAFVAGDYTTALHVLEPLAAKGDAQAQLIVGGSYISGIGVEKDCSKGEPLVRKVAESGIARAQYLMGRMYGTGTCTQLDSDRALKWYKKAAANRDPDATFAVGLYVSEQAASANQPVDWADVYYWYALSLRYFDQNAESEFFRPPFNPLRNKSAAEKNLKLLDGVLSEAQKAQVKRRLATSQ